MFGMKTCLLEACTELLGYVPRGMAEVIKDNEGFPTKAFGWLEDSASVKVLGAEDQAIYLKPGSKAIIITETAAGGLHAIYRLDDIYRFGGSD